MISNIQILRAIAAILVVICHSILASKSYNLPTSSFFKISTWGGAGVDIFFIISGFIMVYIQEKKNKKPLEFIKDRIERIIPLYWLLTLFTASLLLIFPQISRELTLTFDYLLKSLFFLNFLDNQHPLVYLGWTLEYEMLFYIVFAFSLLIKNKNISYKLCIFTLFLFVFIGIDSIIIDFIYGMLVGYLYNKYNFSIKNIYAFSMIVVGFILLSVAWDNNLPRFITWGLPSLLIFLGFLGSTPIKSKLLNFLGDSSYSIYLIQVFTIPLFYKLILKLSFLKPYFINEINVILCVIITIISGCLLHVCIEKPLGRFIKKAKNLKLNKKQPSLE